MFKYIESANTLSVIHTDEVTGKSSPYSFFKTNKGYDLIKSCIEKNDYRRFRFALDRYFTHKSIGQIETKNGSPVIDGVEVTHPVLKDTIARFVLDGQPISPIIEFVKKVRENPSFDSQNRLLACLEKNHHPILHDGRFLAYKRINKDFKDLYTGTIDNSIGRTVTVSRNDVDDNNARTCSHGLHVASFQYARYVYGNQSENPLVICAVDPADVVAVPSDYNEQKMRVCRYQVLDIAPEEEIKDLLFEFYGIESVDQTPFTYDELVEMDEDEDDEYYDEDEDDPIDDEEEDEDTEDDFWKK